MGHILAFVADGMLCPGQAREGHLEVKRESEHRWAGPVPFLFLRLPQEGSGKLRVGC